MACKKSSDYVVKKTGFQPFSASLLKNQSTNQIIVLSTIIHYLIYIKFNLSYEKIQTYQDSIPNNLLFKMARKQPFSERRITIKKS